MPIISHTKLKELDSTHPQQLLAQGIKSPYLTVLDGVLTARQRLTHCIRALGTQPNQVPKSLNYRCNETKLSAFPKNYKTIRQNK